MMNKNKNHPLIEVVWHNSNDEWRWFWLLEIKGQGRRMRFHLQGADDPDGPGKHDGTKFWCYSNEIADWAYYKPKNEPR